MAERFKLAIKKLSNNRIKLLRNEEVIDWIYNQQTFKTQEEENTWGRKIMKDLRPDLKMDKQWTNLFGIYLTKELLEIIWKETPTEPKAIQHLKPDLEMSKCMLEVKTQTYFTTGTATEKILGVPYKYASVPRLFGKPLIIICIGGAEKYGKREGLFGDECSEERKAMLEYYRTFKIKFLPITRFLETIG